VPWQPQIFSAGAYIMHRRAMQQLLDTYLPGLATPMSHARASLLSV
jgi:hypothetical protein